MPAMKFTAKELEVLVLLAKHRDISIREMANKLRISLSNTSRIISRLRQKGFINVTNIGLSKTLSLSNTKHAMLFRNLILEFEHMQFEKLLSGASLEVLSTICYLRLKNRKEIHKNSLVSEVSVARAIEKLKQVGIIQKRGSVYKISSRFLPLIDFVIEFRHYLNLETALNFADDAVILWECNHEFIVETSKEKREKGFILTALSVFHRFGISLMINKYYYFHSLFMREVGIEDVILHSILLPLTHKNILTTLLVLMKNMKNIDIEYLTEQGHKYNVMDSINDMINYLRSEGAERPEGFPTWNELMTKAREYELK